MTITATYIEGSTVQVSCSFTPASGESNLTTFMTFANTIADAITGTQLVAGALSGVTFTASAGITPQASSGWTLLDSFWGGQNNTNGTASQVYTQVFRSLNADGVTYSNIILRYDVQRQEINTSTCESWNATTHAATNEAYTYFDCAPLGFNLAACDMIIMVSPYWCVLHPYLNNEAGLWAGVFENAREDVNDTAENGYPCWGWMSSTLWLLGASHYTAKPLQGLGSNEYPLYSMPRTKQGYTGLSAAKCWSADYGAAMHPNWLTSSLQAFVVYLGNNANKFIANAWDATQRLVLPVKPISDYSASNIGNYGQIFGLKVLAPVGSNMNKLTVPVDSYGNASPTGTNRKHWLLNLHHKRDAGDNNSWFGQSTITADLIATVGSVRPELLISTGSAYYFITQSGGKIGKINAITKTATDIATAGSYTDIKYDGERYVYVTSSSTTGSLVRIDTATDTVVTINSVGFSALAINGDTVVCAPTSVSSSPIFYRFVRQASTGTVNAITASTTATATSPALGESVVIRDMCVDFEGNIWATSTVSTQANHRVIKIPAVTPFTPSLVSIATAAGIFVNVGLQVLDGTNIILWGAVSSSSIYAYQFNPRTSTLVTNSSVSGVSALTSGGRITSAKIQGTLYAVCRNSAIANVTTTLQLGKVNGSNQIGTPIVQPDQQGGSGISNATANAFIFWDGARVISNTDTGIKSFANVNGGATLGGNIYNTITCGQVAIPA